MNRTIHFSHPTIKFTSTVQQICEPFLKANSLSYFQFRRCYGNGKYLFLSNNIEPFLEGMKKNYLSIPYFDKRKTDNLCSVYMANDIVPPIIVSFMKDKYKIFEMVTLIRSNDNYTDLITFGLPEKCEGAASYYASILKDLQIFVNKFLISARPILKILEKNAIFVPMKTDEDVFLPPYNSIGYEIRGRYGKIRLTHEEFLFLHLLHKGKTKCQIAKILDITTHKIDTDIGLITEKTGYPLYLLKPSIIATSFQRDDFLSASYCNETTSVQGDMSLRPERLGLN